MTFVVLFLRKSSLENEIDTRLSFPRMLSIVISVNANIHVSPGLRYSVYNQLQRIMNIKPILLRVSDHVYVNYVNVSSHKHFGNKETKACPRRVAALPSSGSYPHHFLRSPLTKVLQGLVSI